MHPTPHALRVKFRKERLRIFREAIRGALVLTSASWPIQRSLPTLIITVRNHATVCCVTHMHVTRHTFLPCVIISHGIFFNIFLKIGVGCRLEAPPSELAVAVARHFEAMEVDEETVIGGFLARLSSGREAGPILLPSSSVQLSRESICPVRAQYIEAAAEYFRSTAHYDGYALTPAERKRRRLKVAARPGDQVAAKITRTDENGSWILAVVQRFDPDTENYDVQDEDDTSNAKILRLPWNHVMRLSNGTEGLFEKHTNVMAIFPETTSFYRAIVSKPPVWTLQPGSITPIVQELIVKFEDDEGSDQKTPHRRVPSKYVISCPEVYFMEDEDDMDLSDPTMNLNLNLNH